MEAARCRYPTKEKGKSAKEKGREREGRRGGTNVGKDELIVNERTSGRDSIELKVLGELELRSREDGFHLRSDRKRTFSQFSLSSKQRGEGRKRNER